MHYNLEYRLSDRAARRECHPFQTSRPCATSSQFPYHFLTLSEDDPTSMTSSHGLILHLSGTHVQEMGISRRGRSTGGSGAESGLRRRQAPFVSEHLSIRGDRATGLEADDIEELLEQGIIIMTRIDTSRRQQLVGRLKSAVVTAAFVGTLGGWIAFGTQEPATTTVVTTAVPATAPAVAQASMPSNTPSPAVQTQQSGSTMATTDVTPTTTPTPTSSPTAQGSTTAPSSASSSSSTSRRAPVTSTRSSR
jgi:hypothetical protein